MSRTFVKICGITDLGDARLAVAGGADALGFVFHPASPRAVTIEQAAGIAAAVGPFVTTVALFVNAAAEQVEAVLAATGIHLAQFHGDETPEYCRSFRRPYIKAIRMSPGVDPVAAARRFPEAAACLFDAWDPALPGGTGATFEWSRLPGALAQPLILAGGLNSDNVGTAIRAVRPYAVDVSSGVESAPGRKDAARLHAFLDAVRAASHR